MEEIGDSYDPARFLRGDVEKDEEKYGKLNEKHPVPFLRVFGSNYGSQWVPYGSHHFGRQDEQGNCRWFYIAFEGMLEIGGELVFGNWKMTVRGEGMEYIAYNVSKHTASSLKPGSGVNDNQPVKVESITFSPYELKPQKAGG